mmetsp:Transcript_2435/g.5447  ORF Transcript_2435/g.5447 Transcript_2435/m.5447 type:complete len:928 (+) Transcript_2435:38-2821(+)
MATREKSGFLVDQYTNNKQFCRLRSGVFQVFRSAEGGKVNTISLAQASVSLHPDGELEIRSTSGAPGKDLLLQAADDEEAASWVDAVKREIESEAKKEQSSQHLMRNGTAMFKYNYSNSKRMRRQFWISEAGSELCWGKAKTDEDAKDVSKVDLRDCIGIIYGPMTTTFVRCAARREDPAWACFSLLFMGRTLDLACVGDTQVRAWFHGLQRLITRVGLSPAMPLVSDATFITQKARWKLTDDAHASGKTVRVHLIRSLKVMHSDAALQQQLAKLHEEGRRETAARLAQLQAQATKARPVSNGATKPRAVSLVTAGTAVDEALQAQVAHLTSRVRSLEKENQELRGVGAETVGSQVLRERVAELESQLARVDGDNERLAGKATNSAAASKELDHVLAKLQRAESDTARLTQELSSLQRASEDSHAALESSKLETSKVQALAESLQRELDARSDQGSSLQQEISKLSRDLSELQQEKLALQGQVKSLERDLTMSKQDLAAAQATVARSTKLQSVLQTSIQTLHAHAKAIRSTQAGIRSHCQTQVRSITDDFIPLRERLLGVVSDHNELNRRYVELFEERKKLHNLVLELKGNIRVFARCRPMKDHEKKDEPKGEKTISADSQDDTKLGVYSEVDQRRKWFDFDKAFLHGENQQQVFEEVKPLATSVLDGYNVCIFAYGQTGTGKTYTMEGPKEDPGLNTRCLQELFAIKRQRSATAETSVTISVTEIYNETIKDLLDSNKNKKLDVRIEKDGSVGVSNLVERQVDTVEDVQTSMNEASSNRSVAQTDMNEHSSRSHCIVTVKTVVEQKDPKCKYVGKLHLVDLAGSENTNRSGAKGKQMTEASNINKSLAALGDVMMSLQGKSEHVPYRNSKLTMMLKDSLGGDAKTLMIVQISPAQTSCVETLSSLNFASRARNVELGKAKKNVVKG